MGVVIETDELACQVCVEVYSDSMRINISNSRMLKLSPPIPGDSVRIICGDGDVGSVVSQPDDAHFFVKRDDITILYLLSDVIRLDLSLVQNGSANSSPSNLISVEDSTGFADHVTKSSPSYSTGWRVNSPIPPSPMDPTLLNQNPSPSSSLVGGSSTTSPSNSWGVSTSSEPSSIQEARAFSLSSESSASSSNTHQSLTVHSLPPSSYETYQTEGCSTSLPLGSEHEQTSVLPQHGTSNYTHPFGDSAPKPNSPSGNLYPVITGDSVFAPQSNTDFGFQSTNSFQTCQSSGFGPVSYPTLPPYAAATTTSSTLHGNLQFAQPGYIAMVNYNQQSPMLLGNSYGQYGYQPQQQYQQVGVANTRTHSHAYPNLLNQQSGGTQLYPHVQVLCTGNQHSFPRQNNPSPTPCRGLTSSLKNMQVTSRKKSGLYPQLPVSSKLGCTKPQSASPWEEFRLLVNSTQNGLKSKKLTVDIVIDTAIRELSNKSPPQHWYNPLGKTGKLSHH